MLITCSNKGCLKGSNALLDTKTQEVMCGECGQPIQNVADAMKRALKSFGQIVRNEKKAFMLECKSCRANREIVMDQDGNTICKTCSNAVTVHASFKLAMEEAGGIERVVVDKTAVEKKTKAKRKKTTKKVTQK